MVQRKVPDRLGLQADPLLKSEKRLSNLKPASFQHQDGKNRGSDMKKKKKLKRSRSIKISDFESFNSPPIMPQPVKPPPSCSTVTPLKQAMVKSGGGSPNYMKGTTSSEARKERLRKNSDLCTKPIKSLTKSSSLEKVRTLTKSPSFKPVRSVAKKSARAALCADTDVDVQKATCSSTLKDSKFPAYLMLNPGGTESEGTSVVKVCPYTYCSLNGHHHAPSPPLKCFLKAKRRSMKTQKSFKLQASSSPRRVKPCGNETKEISTEVGMDFFVQIYAKNVAYGAGAEDQNKDQVSENVSDASPQSENDLEENCVNGYLSALAEEERAGSCNNESDMESENVSDMEWEEAQFSNSEICEKEYGCCINVEDQSEAEIIGSDDGDNSCTEEILADDVLQELFCEESASCSLECHESDSEKEENWGIFEEKCEESESDLADYSSAATSVGETIEESEVADNDFEGDGDNETAGNELEMNPAAETLDKTEANQSCGLEELPSGTAEDPMEKQEEVPTQGLDNVNVDWAIEHQHEGTIKPKSSTSEGSLKHNNSNVFDGTESGDKNTEVEVQIKSDVEQNSHMEDDGSRVISGSRYQGGSNSRCQAEDSSNRKWTINCRKPAINMEEEQEFNPREPNFLPVVPDPEAEKVDLKHQDMDDRKNAEEWMLDYALQQAVTKLAPARKKKVALLVEAFEKVLPIPKYESRHASAFSHSRPIQACS